MEAKAQTLLVNVNRAPVMTLWAAVVAERLWYSADEARRLGLVFGQFEEWLAVQAEWLPESAARIATGNAEADARQARRRNR